MEYRVKRAPRIDTEITLPGDKSISHRAAIIAALSNGVCVLRGFLPSDDCMHTVNALRALGIKIEQPEPTMLVVHGNKELLKVLAGLFAKGKTTVNEPAISRNHTELMLSYFLVRTAKEEDGGVTIFGDQTPESRDFAIPGDISSAAFWLVAAGAQPGGHLLVRDSGLNDTRTALLGVLIRMGAQLREAVEDVEQLEPRGAVEISGAQLKGTVIQGKEIPQLVDELPVLAVAGAAARGTATFRPVEGVSVR